MYSGEVALVFDTMKHRYSNNGEIIPGVTSVLGVIAKPALVNWAANTATDYIAEQIVPGKGYDELQLQTIFDNGRRAHWQKKVDAGAIGSFVHKFVEDYINGKNPPIPVNEDLKKAVGRFMNWVKEHSVKFLLSEQVIYSRKYKYAGTLDFVCKIDGKMYLGDLKTSNGIYKEEYGMQLAAYKHARIEEFPDEKYAGSMLVRVGKKDGEFEFWQVDDDETYWKGFKNCLGLYRSLEEIKNAA